MNQTIQEDMSDEQLDFLKSQLKEIEEVSYTDDEIDRFEVTFHLNREDMFGKSMLPVDWNKHFKKTYKSQLSYVRNNLKKQMHLN